MDLAWERVYGVPDEDAYENEAMKRGKALEAAARDWYAFTTDAVVDHDPDRTIDHPTIPMIAASPDGLMADRVLETKCPLHKAWMEVKRTGLVPSEYRWQCRWQCWVTGRQLCDFVCWHPLAGGLIVPIAVTTAECDEMATRAALIEKRIAEWVEILQNKREAA
jgi:putative phage-type endonuclease